MKIVGTDRAALVTFDNMQHGEWKPEDQQVLSVDPVTVVLKADGSISVTSKAGRLVLRNPGFIAIFPSWFDPMAEQVIDTKHPVFKNRVVVCYKTTQNSTNSGAKVRHGYLLAFQEKPDEKQ